MPKKLKILIVDDTEMNLLLVSKFINRLGHDTVVARNGLEAVAKFQEENFDLILMDVMMPEMDGYEATAKIREISTQWVPIIFLTAKTQDADQIKGLQVGGDDYIFKPINLPILEARIKSFTRVAEMQQQILENNQLLERYRDTNEMELHLARHLIEKITRSEHIEFEKIRSWNMAAQNFSGDIFISAHTPAGHVHLLLADGTGHGLSAALNVIPVVEVFYSMSTKGFNISTIARELNHKIKEIMPTERFVAATLISINFSEQILNIWNGGNPAVLFLDDKGCIQRQWKSEHPALGIFRDHEFDASSETFHWDVAGQIVLCSDGLVEAQNTQGEEFGYDRLEQTLSAVSAKERHDALIAALHQHMEGLPAHDDVTFASVNCPCAVNTIPLVQQDVSADHLSHERNACRWKIGLHLSPAELKEIDAVPLLLSWMGQLRLSKANEGQIFLIVSELFNNALDHGILKLDSRLKHELDGFEQYVEQRIQRLAKLDDGLIEIELERLRQSNNEILRIKIKDSGQGFDYKQYESADISSSTGPSGRGLALIRTLCTKMEFGLNGSEINVYYTLA